jgi:serine/threonine-protein kinase
MTRAANPYLNRTAIRDDRGFFGRQKELATIFSRIDAGEPQSVSIVGERRIGKSSLLRAVLRRRQSFLRRPDEFVFAYLDLHEKVHGDVSHFFSALLEGFSLSLQDSNVYRTAPTYENIREAVARMDRARLKLVLVLDEFEAITQNENFTIEFFSFLRSLPNNYAVSFIVSSGRELQELCHSKEVAGSPFFNIFHKLNLGSFTPEEAMELITRPSAEAGCPLERYAPDIIKIGGYFPFFLQMACCTFFESLDETSRIVESDVNSIRARFYEQAVGHFQYVWDHLNERERAACSRVSEHQELTEQDRSFAGGLIRRGYVYQSAGSMRLFSEAFDDFVQGAVTRELTGQSTLRRSAELAGTAVGRFTIDKILGAGGMGEVYLAKDTKLKRMVALKRIAAQFRENPEYRRRFLNEAERASQLNHRSIVQVYDVLEDGAEVFLIMEYVEGATLRGRIGNVSIDELLSIARQCAEALAVAHQSGILHCDIKPENILVTSSGEVKVLDFGVAKHLPRRDAEGLTLTLDRTLGGMISGTPAYIPPEIFFEREPDARADIFSLGVVLYELWSGQHPFRAPTTIETANRVLYDSPDPLSSLVPDTPPEIEQAILKCLSKDPNKRYQTTLEFLSALTKTQPGDSTSAHG